MKLYDIFQYLLWAILYMIHLIHWLGFIIKIIGDIRSVCTELSFQAVQELFCWVQEEFICIPCVCVSAGTYQVVQGFFFLVSQIKKKIIKCWMVSGWRCKSLANSLAWQSKFTQGFSQGNTKLDLDFSNVTWSLIIRTRLLLNKILDGWILPDEWMQ